MSDTVKTIDIPSGLNPPVRIDKYLASLAELALSRSRIQRLIADGHITVNGKTVEARHKLTGGERVVVTVTPEPSSDLTPENLPLDVVFEDEHLLVVNKAAGMVTHPAAGNYHGTLVNALLYHLGRLPESDSPERPGIVHRLDKNTTGLLVVAKTAEIFPRLQAMMQRREIKRTYLALVCGHMPNDTGEIDEPIGRSLRDRRKMVVTNVRSREARTAYTVKERFRSYDLLEVTLHTGRTHQIRVHMAHCGHPVFGDPEYGGRDKWVRGMFAPERPLARRLLDIMKRQALHAARLAFVHPITGEALSFSAELPADMQAALDILRAEGT